MSSDLKFVTLYKTRLPSSCPACGMPSQAFTVSNASVNGLLPRTWRAQPCGHVVQPHRDLEEAK